MPSFTRSTHIPASPEELFLFHEDPHNIQAISPPHLRILSIEASPRAQPGEIFTLSLRQGPFRLRWTGCWETVEPPNLLVDTGRDCPFVRWRHEHHFTPANGGTTMTDRVEFKLPWHLGGPLGDMFVLLIVMPLMFTARHAATAVRFTRD